ncbi:PLxRFG domain-containing protein [Acinetobacter bereziniae]|uniref:PLxRFG domain-containing protein n=1 Tax=Acinetobacter bereziniae TaxID=106648 RepID=UPI0015DB25E0|nr:PLxRFG domain-containing protein [Acinetobacter bereziniae]
MSDTQDNNKSKFSFDPTTAKPVDTPLVAKSEGFNFDPNSAKEDKKGVLGHLKDTGASVMSGLAGAAEATTVGLADLYTEGRVGKDIDNTGYYKLGEAQKHWSDKKTDIAKEQEKTRQNTDGIWNKTKYVLENPSQITNAVAESLPYMFSGAALGRASKIANPIVAASVGEGAIMAGSQAESIRQQADDQLLNNGQEAIAAGTGVLGGLFGFAGGRLAQKMGIGDVDTMLVTGRAGPAEIVGEIASMPAKSLPRRVVEGAISEGFLEELPQSVSEQILQNLALDKPWHDGIEDTAVMGTLAGMAMGGAANILSGHNTGTETQDNRQPSSTPNLPSAPPQLGSSPDNALTGEYIPRENVPQGDNQGRTAFVYDQPSMEADNLLNNNYKGDADFDTSGNFDPSNNPLSPSGGNYFEDHSTQPQLPSERLGINPDDGPMSSAAALAVDSGASPTAQLGYTPEQQIQEQSNTPISDAVPSNYQSLLGSQNDEQPFDARFEDATVQQGNAQSNNAGKSISQQYDANAADAMGGGIETDRAKTTTAQTVQPILGQDGKNKWFGNQEKAQAFIDKKKLGNDYQVVQDGKRFEIQPKSQVAQTQNDNLNNQNTISNTENNIDKIQKISALEQQLKNEKSVPKKAQIRKQITELQNGLADQAQSEVSLDQPRKATTENLSGEFKKMEESTARVNAVRQRMREENPEIFTAENDRVRETHGLTNARVTMMADEIETSGSYELSDREYEKIYNNPNFKIDYNPKTYTGTVTAIKDPHTGEWLGNNESIDQTSSSDPQQDIAENKAAFTTNWQKGGQSEITTAPFSSEKIQKQYGDTPDSVMSDIEILGDDFTVDLREDKKKANALSNPNYNAVQKADGSVEIVGMKHPSTGEWVGKKPNAISIDENAHQAATSSQNNTPEPTQAQIEAGNYKKGHIKVHGLDISIENPKGSERRGTDPNGKEWAQTMSDHYGYIKRTKGADNEHIDTYIGNNPDSNQVFIVDQIDQASGNFDEHKVMLGFNNQEEATTAYKSNFDKGWKVGPIRNMDMEQFKDWLKNEDTSKPATDNKAKLPTALRNQQQPSDEVNQNTSTLQDNEVTHIEGKKSESATKNVVEKSFDKAEGNLTKAQYEKMRNGLIADIEQAIAIAPNEATEKITFDVKGDGKFKVHNDKTTLSKFLKQVKANSGFKVPTKPKKSNGITVGSFNTINSIKAMLTDQVDEYSIFNAYQMAQNADIQTIFVKDQSKVEPYFVVEQVTEVDGNPFYLVLRKEKQGTSFLVVSQYGGRLGDSASLANKAKENGLAKINKSGQELILKALRGERERLKDVTQENLKTQFEQKMAEVFGDDVENTSNAIQDEDGIERVQDNRSDRKESIQDLGEKIGGARKDTAVSTGKAKKTKSTDDRPTWAKRYTVSEIVTSTNSNEIGKWVIEDSKKTDWKGIPKKLGTFDSEQEAQDMLPVVAVGLKHRIYARRDGKSGFEIWRQISDVKRVKVVNQVFDTKQDAQTYLIKNATNILETSTTFGELDLPRPENTVRRGTERRKGDAKDTDFMKVFGFRGVEFGNWNNQEERQQLLNDAYDGLLDLAEVLKIPAKAISLNGDLALAFGARGQGLSSARAHYEPAKVVINLTKMNGAGSLAHEWWHAFDHYLARQDGIASAEWVVDADGTRSLKISNNSKDRMVSHGFSYRNSGVREDVRNAYSDLMKTMSTKAEQYVEDVQAVDKFVGQSRDRVKEQLDSLREELSRQRDPKYYKRHNKPASAEQLVVFDTISQKLINGELLETEWRTDVKNKSARGIFSGARWTNDALEQLGEIYKSVRGRSGFSKDQDAVLDRLRSAMNSYANRLKMLADAQKEVSKTRKIPTKFVMDARNLDEGRGSDYWTTPHELSARAFQGFVEDKISENNGHSPFLNHAPENAAIETPWGWMRPYPHGDERKAINAKFTDLVDTLKTEETETGIKLYSRNKLKPDEDRKGASPLSTLFSPLSVNVVDRLVTDILSRITKGNAPSKSNRGINGIVQPKFPYIIVESFETLPEAIQQENYYQDEDGNTKRYDVSAVWHKGTLYINAGDIQGNHNTQQTTYEAYEEVILHEVVGHFGVQQLFGQDYKKKFQKLFNALGGIEGIRKIAKDNGVDMNQFDNSYIKPFKKGVEEGYYDPLDAQQATVSELFAFVAQNAKARPFVRQKLKEVIGYIRHWFRERGFDKFLARYNDADLMMFLSEARKAVIDQKYFGKFKDQKIANNKNDSDQPLYSRNRENSTGIKVQQVRDVLVDRFGKDTINELERQGKLEIIQDYQVEGVEGFYYNGKAVLVASNLTTESTVPTFLHELGGHAGFQNMMNQEKYNELMRQFDKLVEQGNPVAMAAKLLAEREQGSERQQLEYLPYLLTLSSTMEQRNVIQRNALQKLINNIVSYVKAWVFDNFGINLNLNPDDMLALSERMIGQIKHQSSLDLIRQKYHGTDQWMKAPNGEKTHLSEQQWLQVRTPEFKKWFGDWENDAANASQVLDDNGEPKVVYHGTATEFNEFKQGHGLLGDGIYLTDNFDTADVYANIRGENGFVLPLFVNIRNAFKTSGNVSRDEFVKATSNGKYQGIVHQFDNQEYIVALKPNQVKMAEGNTGTFNSESSDIRFSRSAKDIIDNLSKNLGNISISSVKDKTDYKKTDWLGIGLSALGRRQLTEIYGKVLPQLNKYNELAAQMDADKNDAGAEADSIVREWANLNDEDQLAELMHDSTLAKIDPTKPYVSGDSISKYKQLRDAYNSLSPEAQAMYLKARDAYKKHYAKVHQAIKERILRSELSNQKKADLLKQMDNQFFGYTKGVYFPLARFGKYVVVMRNQNGDVESVSRAETMGEAQALRSELIQKFPHYKVNKVKLDKEYNKSRDAVGRGFMTSLFAEVDNLGLSTAERTKFEDTLSQLYLSSMPDLSWAKHGIHRKGTAGFSQDARRAFAQNMFSGANYLAKLRYGDQLAQQLDDMQKYADEQFEVDEDYDQRSAQSVITEMNKRHDNLMNPKGHPLSSALTSMGFIYYLGLSPAAAMVNLSQTALVAYPLMGAKWDFDKAGKELLKASNDFRKGVEFHKVKWQGTKTDLYKAVSSDISKFLNKDEQAAYQKAVDSGVIDVTQAHDLAGIAQGEDSGVMWKTRPIMRAASVMFHSAERFNREVTFIASYRLARQAGANHDDAYKQADKMTYDSHYDYGSGNRPRIMQGNVAKVLLLFKQFGQNMVYTLARQTYQSIKGETKEERREARRAISAILAMHATFAGALGLPMVGMLLSVASWMGGDDDDPWDAEVALRNYLAEAFNPTISNMLMKGAPRGIGVDISGRVGINNLLLPDVQEGLEGKKWWDSASAAVLGPIGGIGANIAKGAQEISEGHNLRGVESMLPVFLKNFAKTYRYADEGVQDKTGVSIMDEVSSMDLLVQGMGFSPSDVRTANEGKTAIYQLNRKLNERRSRLMTLWSRAKMMDDQQEMDEIWEEIQGFNDKNPSRRITRMNLNQSYRNRQRRIDRAEDGIYLSRNRQDAREAGYFAFGE